MKAGLMISSMKARLAISCVACSRRDQWSMWRQKNPLVNFRPILAYPAGPTQVRHAEVGGGGVASVLCTYVHNIHVQYTLHVRHAGDLGDRK
jgi:hypothetical protein